MSTARPGAVEGLGWGLRTDSVNPSPGLAMPTVFNRNRDPLLACRLGFANADIYA